jgi:sugar phosphate permease
MRYRTLSLLCLMAVIAYVQRSAVSVPSASIQRDLRLDAQSMGLVMAVWYWGYAALQIPAGWLADRWGSRLALTIYATVWSLLTGLAGLATGFGEMVLLWGLMGMVQAGAFPCAAKAIGGWFRDTERARASGLLASGMAVGIALAPALTAQLLVWFSWQQTLAVYAVPGLVWAALFFFLVPDPPSSASVDRPAKAAAVDWTRIFTSVSMWLLCGQQFLRAAAMVFFGTWFPRFLQETRGLSQFEAGRLTAWPGVGAMIGGLAGGFASDWILRRTGNRRLSRQGIAVMGMCLCSALFIAAWFVADTAAAVVLMSLGAFWATFGGISGYSVAIEFGGRNIATVFSTMNMCGNIGAGLFPLLVGRLVGREHDWNLTVFLVAGIFALDALCWALLNPRAPLFELEAV